MTFKDLEDFVEKFREDNLMPKVILQQCTLYISPDIFKEIHSNEYMHISESNCLKKQIMGMCVIVSPLLPVEGKEGEIHMVIL